MTHTNSPKPGELSQRQSEASDKLDPSGPLQKPLKPEGKISEKFFRMANRYATRSMAIDLLREKYRLSIADCIGALPEVVQARQKLYTEHLEHLKRQWEAEDAADVEGD